MRFLPFQWCKSEMYLMKLAYYKQCLIYIIIRRNISHKGSRSDNNPSVTIAWMLTLSVGDPVLSNYLLTSYRHIDGLMLDCSNPSALVIELLQS